MTKKEFNSTSFRKGDKVKYEGVKCLIRIINFKNMEFIFTAPYGTCWIHCTEVEYIPFKPKRNERIT